MKNNPSVSDRQLANNKDSCSPHAKEPPFVIPVLREELVMERSHVEMGTVQLRKIVHQQDELVDEPVTTSQVEIVRISIGREISAPIPTRQENETTIYSVIEEVVVVTKQLILKEEIHVTRKNFESRSQQRVVLRREEVVVARSAKDPQESIRVQSR